MTGDLCGRISCLFSQHNILTPNFKFTNWAIVSYQALVLRVDDQILMKSVVTLPKISLL